MAVPATSHQTQDHQAQNLPGPAAVTPSLSDRVQHFMQRVDYRRADTPEQREAIFRLRYDAYVRDGYIKPNPTRRFTDPVDDRDNTWLFGVYVDDRLVSAIRMTVTLPGNTYVPAHDVFAETLDPYLAAGKILVDPSRFITDRDASKQHLELRYVTLRLPWLALGYFGADYMLAAVRTTHEAFYRRLWGHQTVCPPKLYPNLKMHVGLMMLDYRNQRIAVHRRYPFFESSAFERRMLFERTAQPMRREAAA
ncbi:MAG: hypothetical protein AB7K64_07420 [Variibacter sp.]